MLRGHATIVPLVSLMGILVRHAKIVRNTSLHPQDRKNVLLAQHSQQFAAWIQILIPNLSKLQFANVLISALAVPTCIILVTAGIAPQAQHQKVTEEAV